MNCKQLKLLGNPKWLLDVFTNSALTACQVTGAGPLVRGVSIAGTEKFRTAKPQAAGACVPGFDYEATSAL